MVTFQMLWTAVSAAEASLSLAPSPPLLIGFCISLVHDGGLLGDVSEDTLSSSAPPERYVLLANRTNNGSGGIRTSWRIGDEAFCHAA